LLVSDEVVSVEVVRHFCHIATKRLGVEIGASAEALIAGRVAKRLKLLQVPLDEYLSRLEEDKNCDEVVGFLDFVRPRAPHFFARWADHGQLHAQIRRALRAGRRRFRLWSAGCGSGEEPYAMALTALNAIESAGLSPETADLKVLATDISPRALDRGKQGLFDETQMRDVPANLRRRYFTDTDEGVAIAQVIKDIIVFRRLNLAHPPFPMSGPLDAIFCHEGLAHLVPHARGRVIEAATALLGEHGVLCTGFEEDFEDEESDTEEEVRWGAARPMGHC
jgi:chemotaxis protein methyltransferase CheR